MSLWSNVNDLLRSLAFMLEMLQLFGIKGNERILFQSWEGLQLENHEVDTCYLSVNVGGYKFEIDEVIPARMKDTLWG